jgi:hypothetical protein
VFYSYQWPRLLFAMTEPLTLRALFLQMEVVDWCGVGWGALQDAYKTVEDLRTDLKELREQSATSGVRACCRTPTRPSTDAPCAPTPSTAAPSL